MASFLFIVAAEDKSLPSRHSTISHSLSKFSRTSDWPTTRKWRLGRNVTMTKPATYRYSNPVHRGFQLPGRPTAFPNSSMQKATFNLPPAPTTSCLHFTVWIYLDADASLMDITAAVRACVGEGGDGVCA